MARRQLRQLHVDGDAATDEHALNRGGEPDRLGVGRARRALEAAHGLSVLLREVAGQLAASGRALGALLRSELHLIGLLCAQHIRRGVATHRGVGVGRARHRRGWTRQHVGVGGRAGGGRRQRRLRRCSGGWRCGSGGSSGGGGGSGGGLLGAALLGGLWGRSSSRRRSSSRHDALDELRFATAHLEALGTADGLELVHLQVAQGGRRHGRRPGAR
mmetsp:Transcript_35916/g.91031  ORF Transcript_35916/g.91031 Transcript_35916/m.91031 type:complete len:216 (+) Transcript_35916:220-867(+)